MSTLQQNPNNQNPKFRWSLLILVLIGSIATPLYRLFISKEVSFSSKENLWIHLISNWLYTFFFILIIIFLVKTLIKNKRGNGLNQKNKSPKDAYSKDYKTGL